MYKNKYNTKELMNVINKVSEFCYEKEKENSENISMSEYASGKAEAFHEVNDFLFNLGIIK